MADWRQIQARIRKAKTSSDPPAQLAELYERTRDAMVAFELAQFHEKAGNAGETVQWYTTAAQRFRRAQWRTKAEEALTRLGAPIPEHIQVVEAGSAADGAAVLHGDADESEKKLPYDSSVEPKADGLHAGNGSEPSVVGTAESAEESGAPSAAAGAAAAGKRRRRGRRGGRKRRGRAGAGEPAAAGAAPSRPVTSISRTSAPVHSERGAGQGSAERSFSTDPRAFDTPDRHTEVPGGQDKSLESSFEAEDRPQRPSSSQRRPAGTSWSGGSGSIATGRSRAGDPGLSSRIAQLESQLRRMLACPLSSLEEADQAPAGPGVLLLSDSDQVSHYYIEACQTLRIGIGNLLRGGRGSKGGSQLKPSLAEHLGINESKVAKYLKDHCVVRWIQLDEGAPELASFAIAVLRPVVKE